MDYLKIGLDVIEKEAQAIFALSSRLDTNFARACELLLNATQKIVVTGMGKSGHIANKIAATLASTGTPSFFIHPAEASHGDMGMITKNDTVIVISNSGHTPEILVLLPVLKRLNVNLISMCGNKDSTLAKAAHVNLDVSVEEEACPFNLAPTTSTTAALVMGDALAIALLHAREFKIEDYAMAHPGGILGKKLLLQVNDIWHDQEKMPQVNENITINEALIEVTNKKLGMTTVVDDNGHLAGVYTDGDIRRTLTRRYDINTTQLKEVMTRNCLTIPEDTLASEALSIMKAHKITSLVVTKENRPLAVVHMHDLLKAGVS